MENYDFTERFKILYQYLKFFEKTIDYIERFHVSQKSVKYFKFH